MLDFKIAHANTIAYLDVPILLRKQWSKGRWGFMVKSGLLNRFELENNIKAPSVALDDSRFKVFEPQFIRSNRPRGNISTASYLPYFVASIGVEFYLQSHLSIYLEPNFATTIKPLINFGFGRIHAQNNSLNMGMRYHL